MVETVKWPHFIKVRGAKWFAPACGLAAAGLAIAAAIHAESLLPLVVFLNIAALTVTALLSLRVDRSSREARQTSTAVAALAGRVGRLERQGQVPGAGAGPILRSTVAEVTGTVGLLGGVVRELARNVAAQHRDVADLRNTLQSSEPDDAKSPVALRIGPEPRGTVSQPPESGSAGLEPSLLPLPRSGFGEEIGRSRLVLQAFEADGIEVHLQPVIALPERKVRFYEALARLRLHDGTLIGPAEFLPILERFGRAPTFDRRMLLRAVAVARHLVARASEAVVTVNLSPQSLAEAGFLASVVHVLEAAPEVTGKIVLELPQSCWQAFDAAQREAVFTLCGRGVPLSLDGAKNLHVDVRMLAEQGVRFLKLPAAMILAAAGRDDVRDIGLRDLVALLRRSGVKLIAERVDREEMVPALVDLGVPLAQGFVFSAPRAVRAEVMGRASSTLRRVG